MILQSLYQLYDRLIQDSSYRIPPFGFSYQKISFKVILSPEGDLISIQNTCLQENSMPLSLLVFGDNKSSGKSITPGFLWDNTSYMLGYKPDDKNPERTLKAFKTFRKEHLAVESSINSPDFSAVCRFLQKWYPEQIVSFPVLTHRINHFGVFQINGNTSYVHENRTILNWWKQKTHQATSDHQGQCLLSGKMANIARVHPKIKGIAGAQPSGGSIVSFNKASYESYGKAQNFNSPISEEAAFRYTSALNALLEGPMSSLHRIFLGDTTVVFWSKKKTLIEQFIAPLLTDGSMAIFPPSNKDTQKKYQSFLKSLQTEDGSKNSSDKTLFNILGLSPNTARLSVRFFHQLCINELHRNLQKHYIDTNVSPLIKKGNLTSQQQFTPIWMFLRQSARDTKSIPPNLVGSLLRSLFTGCDYPAALFSSIIRQIQADSIINHPRVCFIKGYLCRNKHYSIGPSLNNAETNSAYILGRIFALLETYNSGMNNPQYPHLFRERLYRTASTTPSKIFPILADSFQSHFLQKNAVLKERDKLLSQYLFHATQFPVYLNPEQQGLLAMGYYHQRQLLFRQKRKNEDGQT